VEWVWVWKGWFFRFVCRLVARSSELVAPVAIQKPSLFAFVIITNRISPSVCLCVCVCLRIIQVTVELSPWANICWKKGGRKIGNGLINFYSRQGIRIRPRTRPWIAISSESTESSLSILQVQRKQTRGDDR